MTFSTMQDKFIKLTSPLYPRQLSCSPSQGGRCTSGVGLHRCRQYVRLLAKIWCLVEQMPENHSNII